MEPTTTIGEIVNRLVNDGKGAPISDRPGLRISKPFPTLSDAKAAADKNRTEAQ